MTMRNDYSCELFDQVIMMNSTGGIEEGEMINSSFNICLKKAEQYRS